MTGYFSSSAPWSVSFGQINLDALLGVSNDSRDLIKMVIIANTPQLVLSLMYFWWNGILTTLFTEMEWSMFGHKRKSLRISSKQRGQQRSSYFLQLPYRYSIPLTALSALLHWMLSQCIFVVFIEHRRSLEDELQWGLVTCGFSVMAMIAMSATSLILPATTIVLGIRRLPSSMPLMRHCSLVISAACHHIDGKSHPDAALGYLKWGQMRTKETDEFGSRDIKHCGLSIEDVDEPQEGEIYV